MFIKKIKQKLRRIKLQGQSAEQVFTSYANSNKWGDSESLSGKGSSLEATSSLRLHLEKLIFELNISSLLDIPCGDFNWMAKVKLPDINYIGSDIVESLIAKNESLHSSYRVKFKKLNLISDSLPKSDLVLVRDCLVHFSNSDVKESLENIYRSGGTWLLTTTFINTVKNKDIATGEWRAINLMLPPFTLPKPERIISEGQAWVKGQSVDKSLGLWRIEQLANILK